MDVENKWHEKTLQCFTYRYFQGNYSAYYNVFGDRLLFITSWRHDIVKIVTIVETKYN